MSYTAMLKKWERESKKRWEQDRQERKAQRERAEVFKFEIYLARERQEKQEQKEREERQKRVIEAKNNILLALQKNNPFNYSQWLIIWDVLNYDYDQILVSLNKSRITKLDITGAFEYIKNFSHEIISDYWEKELLSV